MATRIVEGKKPYTGGQAIEIDENKVISLRLRDENNLIIYDRGDDEIYVDLQLPDEITPTDAFPVGITTGRVVVDNGWDKAGTIICAKTTSGDVIKLVYADEGTLWIDNGTGTFKQIYFKSDVDAIITTLTTYINTELAKKQNGVASTTAPTNPSEGDLWYDTTNDEMKVYDGTQWNSVGTGGGGSDIEYVTQAEYTALLPGALTDNKHYFIYTESGGGGWQPGANTVAYYPLKSDILDHSGNNNNFTGGTYTFSDNFIDVTVKLTGPVTVPNGGTGPRTISMWTWIPSGETRDFGYFPSTSNGGPSCYVKGRDSENGNRPGAGFYYSGWKRNRPASVSVGEKFLTTWVKEGATMKLYINAELVSTTNLNSSGTWHLPGPRAELLPGKYSEIIVEDQARDLTMISDYYNLTKGNYGIS